MSALEGTAEVSTGLASSSQVTACDAAEALAGAQIVCTCTNAAAPVLLGDWLPQAGGVHVAAVGSYLPHTQARSALAAQSRQAPLLLCLTMPHNCLSVSP